MDFDPYLATMERIIDAWLPLTFAVNSITRSMGIAGDVKDVVKHADK
jgi:hypothetical protein